MYQIIADVFCGDESLPGKKDGAGTSKDTVHLKWCTPKTTSAPGYIPPPPPPPAFPRADLSYSLEISKKEPLKDADVNLIVINSSVALLFL